MNRIENIKAYKARQDEKKQNAIDEKEIKVHAMTERVKALQPRIKELIETANACLENGIEINACEKKGIYFCSYESGSFMANDAFHRVGFVKTWDFEYPTCVRKISEIGINAGDFGGRYDFRTDGTKIYSVNKNNEKDIVEPSINYLNQFLRNFDDFESAFYNYVDNIINN